MSYNSLFGLGSHSPDASLEGWWPLQETSGSTANDESGKSRDGTIVGPTVNQAGPNGWLTKAFGFDGVDDYVDLPDEVLTPESSNAVFCRFRTPSSFSTSDLAFGTDWPNNGRFYVGVNGAGALYAQLGSSPGGVFTQLAVDTWYDVAVSLDATTATVFLDGTSVGTISNVNYGTSVNVNIGSYNNGENHIWRGRVADVATRSAATGSSDIAEWVNGPEPINTVAPAVSGAETVGETLTSTSGTWGLAAPFVSGSNGTITYAYQWTRSDDASGTGEADITGATSSTYTLVAADEGKFLRCRVRASNDGGFDADADTNSGFTGAIAAESGDVTITAESGSFTLAGQDVSFSRSLKIGAESGSFSLAGQDADFSSDRRVAAESGSFSLAGQDAQFDVAGITNLPADSGSFTLTGQDASLRRALAIIADHGTFDLSGQEATLTKAFRVAADSGAFSLVGQDAAFDVSGDQVIVADPGGFILAGQAAEFDAPEPPPPPVKRYLVFRTN